MGKKIQLYQNSQQQSQTLQQTCDQQLDILPSNQQNLEQQIQIELDYDQLIKHKKYHDHKSNLLIKLSNHQKQIKKTKHKKKSKKKTLNHNQINAKDIIDIVIIVLLVLILGIQLFRVVLQVQIQYKNDQQLHPDKYIHKNSVSETNQHSTSNINQKSQSSKTQYSEPVSQQPSINVILTPQCQKHIDDFLNQHGILYDFNIPYQYFSLKSKIHTYVQTKNTQINKQQYAQAIQLLGIIHRIDWNGSLILQNDPCEKQTFKKQRLQKILTSQFKRLNQKYFIDFYHSKQLRFCLIVNSYNNAKNGLIYRNIDSILQQNYTNYYVYYTDDNSTDQTGHLVKSYLQLKNIPQSKFKVIVNKKKNGMMQNIYNAVYQGCQQGEIAAMIDGDDSLIGTNVLSLLNAVYQKQKPAVMWANFLCIFNNNLASMGFSRDYTNQQKQQKSFRKLKGFISSHLKTFFVDIFRKIKPQDLQQNDGKFYGGASDTAMMLPMIQMAYPRIKYLPQVLYEYRYDTGQTGNIVNKIPQKQALKKIYSSQIYESLKDFSFIQTAIENALQIKKE